MYARKIRQYDVSSGRWLVTGLRVWDADDTDYMLGEGDIVLVNEQRVKWNTDDTKPFKPQRYIGRIQHFNTLANDECEIKLLPLVYPENDPNPYKSHTKLPYYSAINTNFLEFGFYKLQKLHGFSMSDHRCFGYCDMQIGSKALECYFGRVAGEIFKNAYHEYPKGEEAYD